MVADVSAADVAAFRRSGVLVMPHFFSPGEAAAMRASVAVLRDERRLFSDLVNPQRAGQNLQMAWLSQHSMLWQCLPWEPRVVAAVERLLLSGGPITTCKSADGVDDDIGVEVHYDQCFHKPARVGAGTAWHTDNGYFRIHDPLKGVGMWIAIDDASTANGTLHVLPGVAGRFAEPTHGRDPQSTLLSCADEIDDGAALSCELAAGGVVFFCYGVPHCTRSNPTSSARCAVAYHFITTAEIERHESNERDNPRGGVRRILTGPRASDGRDEYGEGADMAGRWAPEVTAVLRGEGQPSLPPLTMAVDGDFLPRAAL
jgi:phytanoyl-CoA hydroxylase